MFGPCALICSIGQGLVCHSVVAKKFDNVEADVVQHKMHSGKEKVHWNDRKSNRPRNTLGIVQVCLDKTASTMKLEAFVMFPSQCHGDEF